MKDEIKENLSEMLFNRDERLLDYITNLQEERDYLYNKLSSENEHIHNYYKSRIDKAIKYIKEHIRIDDEYPAYMEMLVEEKDELLNILQGGDEK